MPAKLTKPYRPPVRRAWSVPDPSSSQSDAADRLRDKLRGTPLPGQRSSSSNETLAPHGRYENISSHEKAIVAGTGLAGGDWQVIHSVDIDVADGKPSVRRAQDETARAVGNGVAPNNSKESSAPSQDIRSTKDADKSPPSAMSRASQPLEATLRRRTTEPAMSAHIQGVSVMSGVARDQDGIIYHVS